MPATGRLLLVETVIPPGNDPFSGKLADVAMLVWTGGQERTEAEYRALLAAAGFELTRVVPTRSSLSVVEGVPRYPASRVAGQAAVAHDARCEAHGHRRSGTWSSLVVLRRR